jgi:hypothetical protein
VPHGGIINLVVPNAIHNGAGWALAPAAAGA